VDEAEDLLSFFALAQVGIRVAKGLPLGVLRQEGEDAFLAGDRATLPVSSPRSRML